MALILADRVQESSTTTGTGDITLSGAYAGFQTFAAGIGNGNTCYYTITSDTNQWEVGIGTVGVGTLARTTLISSSTGAKVSFTGTLTVFVTYPAEKAVYTDSTTIVAPAGALLPITSGGTGASTAAAARTALGLGTIATQAANNVAITGGAIDGTTVGSTTAAAGSFSTLNSSGDTRLGGLSGNQSLQVNNVASAVNYAQIVGAVTTGAPLLSVQGSDANISLSIISKGTGAIDLVAGSSGVNISNGGTVTAITRTAAGGGYTSIPTVVIPAPTSAGGVQATADAALEPATFSIISGGSGYAVSDVVEFSGGTFFTQRTRLTVTTVSAGVITGVTISTYGRYTVLPTSPNSVTTITGTGSGASIAITGSTFFSANITNAGSGYVEQPTITFSGGGGGTGASAYAIIGSGTTIKSLGSTLSFNTTGGTQLRISDASAVNYAQIVGAVTGGSPTLSAQGTDTNINFAFASKGTGGFNFTTGGGQQVGITSTASAVNYLQLTGAATNAAPTISAQGSDANIGLVLSSKGTGVVALGGTTTANSSFAVAPVASSVNYIQAAGVATGGNPLLSAQGTNTDITLRVQNKGTLPYYGTQFENSSGGVNFQICSRASSVNYFRSNPAATGNAPELSAQGSDANINIKLTPQGTGTLQFGTYTAGVVAQTGYITITDAGGTSRRLLVG